MADVREVMTEWLQLKAQLKAARADLGVLNKRERELKMVVQNFMKKESTDVVKINQSKISFSSKNVKGSMTKEAVLSGLRNFFGGNEAQVEGAFQAIQDAIPVKERDSLTVRKWD